MHSASNAKADLKSAFSCALFAWLSDSQGPVVIHDQRRVLREARLAWQTGAAHEAAQAWGQYLIIEAPAQIQHLGLFVIRPPAVLITFAADFTQGIDIAHGADNLVHPGAFRRQEARRLLAVTPVLMSSFCCAT